MLLREAGAMVAEELRWTTSWRPCLRSAKGVLAAGAAALAEGAGFHSALAAEAFSVRVSPRCYSCSVGLVMAESRLLA